MFASQTVQCSTPKYLWHIDGYLKLYQVVVGNSSGGICYSKIPVYLYVAINNRSFDAFFAAVKKFGLLLCVRADHRGPNVLVAPYRTEHTQRGRGSFIAGQSVHNQRIEHV